jgi:hypothetical protein
MNTKQPMGTPGTTTGQVILQFLKEHWWLISPILIVLAFILGLFARRLFGL